MISVAELIEILKEYPPDLPVLVDGYEAGMESSWYVEEKDVFYQGDIPYEGDYREYHPNANWLNGRYKDQEVIKALYIGT